MEPARQRARIRLIDSIQSKEGVQVMGSDIHTEEGRLLEAFSFYYARLVMCASEDERLIARWAQAEAARAEQLLIQDVNNLPTIANTYITQVESVSATTMPAVSQGMSMPQLRQQGAAVWRIGLADFIEICPKITGHRWRLPNVDIEGGWVKLHDERQYASSAKLARYSANASRSASKPKHWRKWPKSPPILPFAWPNRLGWSETCLRTKPAKP